MCIVKLGMVKVKAFSVDLKHCVCLKFKEWVLEQHLNSFQYSNQLYIYHTLYWTWKNIVTQKLWRFLKCMIGISLLERKLFHEWKNHKVVLKDIVSDLSNNWMNVSDWLLNKALINILSSYCPRKKSLA